ncbi:hypothetical protein [Kitasatospora purpeofusca]|uniref:hypothetical protein n=1 Tax=Kitasatospora purpeofusca TaxID=67352 RepID=UPI0036D39E76
MKKPQNSVTHSASDAVLGFLARTATVLLQRARPRRPSGEERSAAELTRLREARNRAGDSYPLW